MFVYPTYTVPSNILDAQIIKKYSQLHSLLLTLQVDVRGAQIMQTYTFIHTGMHTYMCHDNGLEVVSCYLPQIVSRRWFPDVLNSDLLVELNSTVQVFPLDMDSKISPVNMYVCFSRGLPLGVVCMCDTLRMVLFRYKQDRHITSCGVTCNTQPHSMQSVRAHCTSLLQLATQST